MKKVIASVGSLAALLPGVAFAQGFTAGNLNTIAGDVLNAVNTGLLILMGIAVIVFIVGIIQFVLRAGDADKRKEARGYMIYSVIAFAVIIGLYGLANSLLGFFGVDSTSNVIHGPSVS